MSNRRRIIFNNRDQKKKQTKQQNVQCTQINSHLSSNIATAGITCLIRRPEYCVLNGVIKRFCIASLHVKAQAVGRALIAHRRIGTHRSTIHANIINGRPQTHTHTIIATADAKSTQALIADTTTHNKKH